MKQLTDEQKLADQMVAAQKRAELDREMLRFQLNETQYQLHKAQAERMACVIALVAIIVLVFVRGCSL